MNSISFRAAQQPQPQPKATFEQAEFSKLKNGAAVIKTGDKTYIISKPDDISGAIGGDLKTEQGQNLGTGTILLTHVATGLPSQILVAGKAVENYEKLMSTFKKPTGFEQNI